MVFNAICGYCLGLHCVVLIMGAATYFLKYEMPYLCWGIDKPDLIRNAFCFVNIHAFLTCAWWVVNLLYR